jgi:hypothetical protein
MVELKYVESISHVTVRSVLKKNELKPWKVKGWVIPPEKNSDFVANMERVLDVYKKPYDPAFPVVCMDESPKQLIEEGKQFQSMKPGYETRVDYEYIRHGVVNIFMAIGIFASIIFRNSSEILMLILLINIIIYVIGYLFLKQRMGKYKF